MSRTRRARLKRSAESWGQGQGPRSFVHGRALTHTDDFAVSRSAESCQTGARGALCSRRKEQSDEINWRCPISARLWSRSGACVCRTQCGSPSVLGRGQEGVVRYYGRGKGRVSKGGGSATRGGARDRGQ